MPRGDVARTLIAFPAFLGYVVTIGAWWKFRSVVRKREVIVTEVHSSAFGVMVFMGPLVVESLGSAHPDSDIIVMGDFNGANRFALNRLGQRSPENVHVHSTLICRWLISWYRPGSLMNPAVKLWNYSRYPQLLKPLVIPFQSVLGDTSHLEIGAVELSRNYFALTRPEFQSCRALLEARGMNLDDGFVCFNVRDDSWRQERQSQLFIEEIPRPENSDVETYVPAIHEVLNSGKAVIRVGRRVQSSLNIKKANFFDYATSDLRSDLLDFFFGEFCDLAVSTGTGWDILPKIMGRNVHLSNFTTQDVTSLDSVWLETLPPITLGFKRSVSIDSGEVSLGLWGGPLNYSKVFFPAEGAASHVLVNQTSRELTRQVAFALRLQQDPEYLEQVRSDQYFFQCKWWASFGGDTLEQPKWLPLLEPGYLAEYGESLSAGA